MNSNAITTNDVPLVNYLLGRYPDLREVLRSAMLRTALDLQDAAKSVAAASAKASDEVKVESRDGGQTITATRTVAGMLTFGIPPSLPVLPPIAAAPLPHWLQPPVTPMAEQVEAAVFNVFERYKGEFLNARSIQSRVLLVWAVNDTEGRRHKLVGDAIQVLLKAGKVRHNGKTGRGRQYMYVAPAVVSAATSARAPSSPDARVLEFLKNSGSSTGRAVASQLKSSHSTVGAVLKRLVGSGKIRHVDKQTGYTYVKG